MYRVMLLDDEPWELKGLKNMLPWGDYDFTVTAALNDPLEALNQLTQEHYDVLVSDIRMPGLDGISLMKEIRNFDSNLEIIFVSGYAEFEYAREALRAGAYDYLLKPVDLDETETLLAKLKKKLDTKGQQALLLLMDKISGEKISFCDMFPTIDEGFHCYALMGCPSLFTKTETEKLKADSDEVKELFDKHFLSLPYGSDCFLYFFACRETFMPETFLRKSFSGRMLGLSSPFSGKELSLADGPARLMRQAFCAYHASFFLHEPELYLYQETDKNSIRHITEQVRTLYTESRIGELNSYVSKLPQVLRSISIHVDGMVRLWNQLMLLTDADLYEESCFLSAEHMLEHHSTIEQLAQKLCLLLGLSAQSLTETEEGSSCEDSHAVYSAMIRYVNEHFTEPITLADVADCVHISFTYASKLFKKYTDTNYSKYLTDLRMNLACSLLSDSEKTTEEICYETGYKDYFYFNKTFKKYTGQTPLQYRRKESCN